MFLIIFGNPMILFKEFCCIVITLLPHRVTLQWSPRHP